VRLLIGSESEQAAVIRVANGMHASDPSRPLLVLLGAAESFSFRPRPSTILVPGMPDGVIAAVPSLEEFGIASRLASEAGLPGCYDGPVLELAQLWLNAIEPSVRAQVEITVVGGDELVRSAEQLGRDADVAVRALGKE
jgi:dihydroorotate dehydrogenase electron transfer subunit